MDESCDIIPLSREDEELDGVFGVSSKVDACFVRYLACLWVMGVAMQESVDAGMVVVG